MTQRVTRVSGTSPQMPVSIEEVKMHLRVTDDVEDILMASNIQSALQWAEEISNRAIVQRSYLVVHDDFPIGYWKLPLGYVKEITSVKYLDSDGTEQTWSSSEYMLDNASDYQCRLYPKPGYSWPSTGDYASAARVTLVAGWDNDNVPYTLKQAIFLKLGSFFDTRAPGDEESQSIDDAATTLLMAWKLPTY